MIRKIVCLAGAGWLLTCEIGLSQNLAPNPTFAEGDFSPTSWNLLYEGFGQWEEFGHTDNHCVSVAGDGVVCPRRWETTECAVEPGQPYLVRFWGKGEYKEDKGTVYGGFDAVTRDFGLLPEGWSPVAFIAAMPDNAKEPVLRFGQCSVNGVCCFDDVAVHGVSPLHAVAGGYELGSGESFRPGHYSFETLMDGFEANYSRCLERHTAEFGTDGWVLSTNQHVVYRHGFKGMPFSDAEIHLGFKYREGALIVEVSKDGQTWQAAGRLTAQGQGHGAASEVLSIPHSLFPTDRLFTRLRVEGRYWLTKYSLEAGVPGLDVEAVGKTWFFEQRQTNSPVKLAGMRRIPAGFVLDLNIENPTPIPRQLALTASASGAAGERQKEIQKAISPTSTNIVSLELPSAGAGENSIEIEVSDAASGDVLLDGEIEVEFNWFDDNSYGYRLPGPPDSPVWWCEGTYKVNRHRALPMLTNDAVTIEAARNEYEPFQLIIRPETPLNKVVVSVSDFRQSGNDPPSPIYSTNVEVALVDYVPVTHSREPSTELGDYPDPLPPLIEPVELDAKVNQPLWFTVHVPKSATAGEYEATITVSHSQGSFEVPVLLQVFDFTLSDVTHTKTAYGVEYRDFWHRLDGRTDAQERKSEVWDLYMQNFRRHRISPFRPQTLARIKWNLEPTGSYSYDFSAFDDALARYVDEFDFTAFNWDEERSSGTFNLDGHKRFSPEYRELYAKLIPPIMRHLREKGWMSKAYSFWFDEPQPPLYPHVIEGMELLKRVAPDLRRMLTIYPDPSLYGHVEIWSPIFTISVYELTHERWADRRARGEEIWPYVATYPFMPLPNNWIDHPALFPRLRSWMAEKYGITGEVYWQVNHFIGEGHRPRNPWTNAMTFEASGGLWGNGDGTLVYPPTRTPPQNSVVAGPINSLRWEIIREAMEDREYFWLLDQLLARAKSISGMSPSDVLEGVLARSDALDLITSPQEYESNPQAYYTARRRIARAIENLDTGAPFFVRDPKSQAVKLGSSIVLHAEALGWPPPHYQWRLNGIAVEGATGESLVLTNIGPAEAGEWCAVASNAAGVAISGIGRIAGYWEKAPQIVFQPASITRAAGEEAVFVITAVGSNALSYQWIHEGAPLPGEIATALRLTKLTSADAGGYQAVVSNISGAVTSTVAQLKVLNLVSNAPLVPTGAVWRYSDRGLDPGEEWTSTNYDDSGWSSGPAELGFGDGDERTIVSAGPDSNNQHVTTYFRHSFFLEGTLPNELVGRLLRDDGAVVYLNGHEVYRSNLTGGLTSANPTGAPAFSDLALKESKDADESTWYPFGLPWFNMPKTLLQPGKNVVAVAVHLHSGNSDDLSFDFELSGSWKLQ